MARPSNTEQRRAEIVQALGRVMAREGYEQATIALIAQEAGLGGGLVHYHFRTKHDILLALVDTLAGAAEQRIEAHVEAQTGATAKLDALLDALLARGPSEEPTAVACWALIGAQAVKDQSVMHRYAAFITRLVAKVRALLDTACDEAGRSTAGSDAMASALVAMIEGYFALAAAVPDAIPRGSAADMARRTMRGLIATHPKKGGRA